MHKNGTPLAGTVRGREGKGKALMLGSAVTSYTASTQSVQEFLLDIMTSG